MNSIKMPNMWLVHNDRLNLYIRRNFKMVDRHKIDGINERQPGARIENGYVYNEMLVYINTIDDRGDYWYIGYEPAGKDKGRCTFGYTRYYKDRIPEYGTIAFIDVTNNK